MQLFLSLYFHVQRLRGQRLLTWPRSAGREWEEAHIADYDTQLQTKSWKLRDWVQHESDFRLYTVSGFVPSADGMVARRFYEGSNLLEISVSGTVDARARPSPVK